LLNIFSPGKDFLISIPALPISFANDVSDIPSSELKDVNSQKRITAATNKLPEQTKVGYHSRLRP